ncbi:hypothetical protein Taro_009425 [Colocasia esculenta]|uniref:Uncharacterized protein n=1 Tax=Colocasia esculenta TaxID=4460 RepID=A0A843U5M0_COLES|nr:hypothetical protein [Colocasia esculenta]
MLPGNPGFSGNGYVHPGLPESNRFGFGQPEKARYRRGRGAGRGSFRAGSISSSYPQQHHEERAVPRCTEFDMAYFQSYSHVGIHEEMIKDHVRTETYRDAIMRHQNSIAGKVVMDVGCGTGILSIFCALAGAKRVYAVDASEIAVQANEVVKANNLSDKIIVLHGRIESMLGSVITARDRWLKPGGLILPSHATVNVSSC